MNSAVKALVLDQFNSFGALVKKVDIPLDLAIKLEERSEFCRKVRSDCYFTDGKTKLQFRIDGSGYALLTEFIEFQGPQQPKEVVARNLNYVPEPVQYYTNNKFKGD